MFRNLARKKTRHFVHKIFLQLFFFTSPAFFQNDGLPNPPNPIPIPSTLLSSSGLSQDTSATDVAEVQVVVRKADVLHRGDPWSVDWWTGFLKYGKFKG